MATRSAIAIYDSTKKECITKAIYVHYDGYPEHVGATLVNHYRHKYQAEQLVNGGHLNTLGYSYDQCDPLKGYPFTWENLSWLGFIEAARRMGCEYVYSWYLQNARWECFGLGVTPINLEVHKIYEAAV